HHFDDDCLIWLYDIHLLASQFSEQEWEQFSRLAHERAVARVCRHSLARATALFDTPVPEHVQTWDQSVRAADAQSARYLSTRRRPVENLVEDLRALRRWSERGRLIREHLFPPSDYMRSVYAPNSRAPLSVLYARRVLRGARKWFARP